MRRQRSTAHCGLAPGPGPGPGSDFGATASEGRGISPKYEFASHLGKWKGRRLKNMETQLMFNSKAQCDVGYLVTYEVLGVL